MTRAPTQVESARLTFRQPVARDAPAIFERYSCDPHTTRYMAWARHRSVADAYAFISFSDAEWRQWPAGPYMIRLRADDTLLGSTGFAFETPERAIVGYILARDAWGKGYATEALRTMIALAPRLGVRVLTAGVHAEHAVSARVLEKCGFQRDGAAPLQMIFPNIGSHEPRDVINYALHVASTH